MTRRADPERIHEARRAAVFANLTQTGAIDPLDAGHWIARWERAAEARGLDRFSPAFWIEAESWIEAQIRSQR